MDHKSSRRDIPSSGPGMLFDKDGRMTLAGSNATLKQLINIKNRYKVNTLGASSTDCIVNEAFKNGADLVKKYFTEVLVQRLLHESDDLLEQTVAGIIPGDVLWLRQLASVYQSSKCRSSIAGSPTSSASYATPSSGGSASSNPSPYRHSEKKFKSKRTPPPYKPGQNMFTFEEDQILVEAVLRKLRQLRGMLGSYVDAESSLDQFLRSDKWDFDEGTGSSLTKTFNDVARERGRGARLGSSLKSRWKKHFVKSKNCLDMDLFDTDDDKAVFTMLLNNYAEKTNRRKSHTRQQRCS